MTSRRYDPDNPDSYVDPEVPGMLMRAALRQSHMAPWERERDRCIVGVCYYLGLRAFEVGQLDVGDVRLEARRMRVRVQKGSQRAKHPKQPVMLYFGRRMAEALAAYLPTRQERWGAAFPILFPSRLGTRVSRTTVWAVVKRLARLAGLDEATIWPHKFRHALASHSFEAGLDAAAIQKALRHESLATTTVYSDTSQRRRAEAAEALDTLGGGGDA